MFNNRINILKSKFDHIKSKCNILESNISDLKSDKKLCKTYIMRIEETQVLIMDACKKATEDFKTTIANMSAIGLEDVFKDKYEIEIEFKTRGKQNVTSDAFITMKYPNGFKSDPMYGKGGGLRDCLAFLLRVSLLTMSVSEINFILILDEPLRDLSEDLRELGGYMIKDICKKLDIQVIMSSNESNIMKASDKIIKIQ